MEDSETTVIKVNISPTDLVFGEATDRQRALISTIGGGPQPPITPEQYITGQKKLSRPGVGIYEARRYFCLARKNDPDVIVSTCEVQPRKALVADANNHSNGARIVEAYAISSVYTPPEYRGQGMASYMLKRVQDVVDKEGYECGVLYSEIGREYYTKLGWRAFDTKQLFISLDLDTSQLPSDETAPAPLTNAELQAHKIDGVRLVSEAEIPPLCELDIQLVSSKLEHLAASLPSTTQDEAVTRFVSLLPNYRQIAFHILRDTYIIEVLYTARGRTPPKMYHGAVTNDKKSWVCWDHGLPHPESKRVLRVLRVVTSPDDTVKKRTADLDGLLRAAIWEARRFNLGKVVIWEPSGEVVDAAMKICEDSRSEGEDVGAFVKNVTVEDRKDEDGSIPCLRWRGHSDRRIRDGGDSSLETVWICNEAFGWC